MATTGPPARPWPSSPVAAIRFESARAASSWTLPSHATMFTGKWLHELSVGWVTPLDGTHPTLAEFLGAEATRRRGLSPTWAIARPIRDWNAGSLDTRISFSRAHRAQDGGAREPGTGRPATAVYLRGRSAEIRRAHSLRGPPLAGSGCDRKGAAAVNRELLDWLSDRPHPDRPFFAFLNYNDAHYPYELPPGRIHRFGAEPTENDQRHLIGEWGELDKTGVSPAGVAFAAACL